MLASTPRAERLSLLAFVRRRTVDRWHPHVVQPQVHTELAPMVDDVVQHEAPEGGDAWRREHLPAAPFEGPGQDELGIGPVQKGPRLPYLVVEIGQDRGARRLLLEVGRHGREIDR